MALNRPSRSRKSWWSRVAWGFLRLVGGDGRLNVDKKLRLQLFKPVSTKISITASCGPTPLTTPEHKFNMKNGKHPTTTEVSLCLLSIIEGVY